MGRPATILLLLGCAVVMAAFAGLWWLRDQTGRTLVMPGAGNVTVEHRGASRVVVAFSLPPEKTFHDLRRSIEQQGWHRMKMENIDRTTMTFIRTALDGTVREIVTISRDPLSRKYATVSLVRCFRIGPWVRCP